MTRQFHQPLDDAALDQIFREARTYNGDIHLRGVADRSELDVTTKTRNGHVSKH